MFEDDVSTALDCCVWLLTWARLPWWARPLLRILKAGLEARDVW